MVQFENSVLEKNNYIAELLKD